MSNSNNEKELFENESNNVSMTAPEKEEARQINVDRIINSVKERAANNTLVLSYSSWKALRSGGMKGLMDYKIRKGLEEVDLVLQRRMDKGSAFELALFDPEGWRNVRTYSEEDRPDKSISRTTKKPVGMTAGANKAWLANLEAEAREAKTFLLLKSEKEMYDEAVQKIHRHRVLKDYFQRIENYQVPVEFEFAGSPFMGFIDGLGESLLADIKFFASGKEGEAMSAEQALRNARIMKLGNQIALYAYATNSMNKEKVNLYLDKTGDGQVLRYHESDLQILLEHMSNDVFKYQTNAKIGRWDIGDEMFYGNGEGVVDVRIYER